MLYSASIPDLGRHESVQMAARSLRVPSEFVPRNELDYEQRTDLEHHSSVSSVSEPRRRDRQITRSRGGSMRAEQLRAVEQVVDIMRRHAHNEATRYWIDSGGRRMTSRHDYRLPRTETGQAPLPSCLDIMLDVSSISRSSV